VGIEVVDNEVKQAIDRNANTYGDEIPEGRVESATCYDETYCQQSKG